MSTQQIDAIEFAKRVQMLIRDCLRRDNIPRCDLDAMLFAYGEVLEVVAEMCDIRREPT